MKSNLKVIALVLAIFTVGLATGVLANFKWVNEDHNYNTQNIEEHYHESDEVQIVEKEVVVTETEIVYVDRPLGVTEDELNFYLWYTFEVFDEVEENGEDAYIILNEEDMTVEIHDGQGTPHVMAIDEYLEELYDYYDYIDDWS